MNPIPKQTAAEAAQIDRLAGEVLATIGIQITARAPEPRTEQEMADQILMLAGFKQPTPNKATE